MEMVPATERPSETSKTGSSTPLPHLPITLDRGLRLLVTHLQTETPAAGTVIHLLQTRSGTTTNVEDANVNANVSGETAAGEIDSLPMLTGNGPLSVTINAVAKIVVLTTAESVSSCSLNPPP